jgi:hypothetical protein
MVKYSPGTLASILAGSADCRFGPRAPKRRIAPEEIHTLVLWTKDPSNITRHPRLSDVLRDLVGQGGQIFLQLTVTSLGSTPVEMDIPTPETIADYVKRELFSSGLIRPEAVKLRYDPVLELRYGKMKLGNMSERRFSRILELFRSLGISRYVTSYVDYQSYPKIERRLESLGLELVRHTEDRFVGFVSRMNDLCRLHRAELQVCCNPAVSFSDMGCIDGNLLNRLMEERGTPELKCTTTPHNAIGRQRPSCKCTYSHDIGYSTGVTQCYSQGGGCLYCYSQPEAINEDLRKRIVAELEHLRPGSCPPHPRI